jgi:hypothetical protein
MRIGVCIPGHYNHLHYLPQVLQNIESQTLKPTVISISVSSFSGAFPAFKCSIPLKISITSEAACAGKNRNTAAAAISSEVDILSFFDMDDLMHPKRLEIIHKAFVEKDIDMFVHNYQCVPRTKFFCQDEPDWPSTGNPIFTNCFATSRDCICGRVEVQKERMEPKGDYETGSTKGHISETVEVWKVSPFPENYGLGEDCENLYNLYMKMYTLGYCPDKLSLYYK